MISRFTDDAGNADQEPWQVAQAARVAATIAAVANDPDPNAVGRALGYDMGGGGLVGLAGTVAGAMVDISRVATPVLSVAAPELLPVVAGLTAAAKVTSLAAHVTQGGPPTTALDMVGAASAALGAMHSQIDGNAPPRVAPLPRALGVDRFSPGAPGPAAAPWRDRASLAAALSAMTPARAQAALEILALLRQQGRI